MTTTRRAFLVLGALATAGAAGGLGVRAWRDRPSVRLLRDGWRYLAEGRLRDAAVEAALFVDAYPADIDGYLLSYAVLDARNDRAEAARVLRLAYDAAPRGFPLLPAYVAHRLLGRPDPRAVDGVLAFLDQHAGIFPEDAAKVAHARLVAYTAQLGDASLPGDRRLAVTADAEAALAAFRVEGAGTTAQHHDRAALLLALGRYDDVVAAARAGVAADSDPWRALLLHWALVCTLLHHGDDEAAYDELPAFEARLHRWSGTHHGMAAPLYAYARLTAALRFGYRLAAPPDQAERLARVVAEGCTSHPDDAAIRDGLDRLHAAIEQKDPVVGARLAEEVLPLVERRGGSEIEAWMVGPSAACFVLAARGEMLFRSGKPEDAEDAYRAALTLFPENLWLDAKVGSAQFAVPPGEERDPLALPSTRRAAR
ncbi:MAG: hypothetical protein ACK4YP_13380 [Myxococcota bacterium]